MLGLTIAFAWFIACGFVFVRDHRKMQDDPARGTEPRRYRRTVKALHILAMLSGVGAAIWMPLQVHFNSVIICDGPSRIPPLSLSRDGEDALLLATPFLILLGLAATTSARRATGKGSLVIDLIASLMVVAFAYEDYRNGTAICAQDDEGDLGAVIVIFVLVWPWVILSSLGRLGFLAAAKLYGAER
jgi:hypothetical protein